MFEHVFRFVEVYPDLALTGLYVAVVLLYFAAAAVVGRCIGHGARDQPDPESGPR